MGCWEKHEPGSYSVTNTSRWMGHCWKLGRRTKASGRSIPWPSIRTTRSRNHRRHGGTRITPRSTIGERNAAIRPTVPAPIRKHAGPQGTRKGSEVELPRTPDDGKSERTGGEHPADHGLRFGGVSCRDAYGGTVAGLRTRDIGSG